MSQTRSDARLMENVMALSAAAVQPLHLSVGQGTPSLRTLLKACVQHNDNNNNVDDENYLLL